MFLDALASDFEQSTGAALTTAPDIVRHFAVGTGTSQQSAEILDLFYAVRRALKNSPPADSVRRAAAALYCLGACRLVNRAAYEKQAKETGSRLVFHVPADHDLVCAVIATALFGGQLDLQVDGASHGLRSKYVFKVQLPTSGDWSSVDFERAAFAALFSNDSDLPDVTSDTGPLPLNLRARLRARLASIRHVELQTFALVVTGVADTRVVRLVAESYQAPVFLSSSMSSETALALLGIDPQDLQAEIQEFFRDYQAMAPEQERPSSSTGSGFAPLSGNPVPVSIHVSGENAVVSTGPQSIVQAGTAHHVQQVHGGSVGELLPLIRELAGVVQMLPSASERATVRRHVDELQAETSKGSAANAGVFKGTLEKIKSMGDAIDGGETIVELCGRIRRVAGPLLAALGSQL